MLTALIVGGALAAAGGIASSVINAKSQRSAMNDQMAWQESMNEQQQEWLEGMWNKNNLYNAPSAQMSRLMDAGVNPNNAAASIAGASGAGNSVMPQQPQTPSAPSGFSPYFSNIGEDALGGAMYAKQLEKIKADIENVKADTANKTALTEGQNLQNSVFLTTWNVEQAGRAANIDLTKAQAEQIKYNTDVILPQQSEINQETINNLKGAGLKLVEEIRNTKKQGMLIDEQAKTERAQQGVLGAQENLLDEQKNFVKEQAVGQYQKNAVDAVKSRIAQDYGVDISQLDAMEQINIELEHAGASDEEKNTFWNNVFGDFSKRLKRGAYTAGEGAASNAADMLSGFGRRGLRPRPGSSSTVNPRPFGKKKK